MNDNSQAASPVLVDHGYCVFAFNYEGAYAAADFHGTGDIAASAGQLAFLMRDRRAPVARTVRHRGGSRYATP